MSYCKVAHCRFSSTHVTKGHKCGPCGQYGHGEIECSSYQRIFALQVHHNDILPNNLQCTVSDCKYKELHTTDAHHCPKCGLREVHTVADCRTKVEYNVQCPVCRTQNILIEPEITEPESVVCYASDECVICYNNVVQVFFPACKHMCLCMHCLKRL